MNSPGNDLEGIAGQVASGCNLVLFVTGNGSITNFPFVPTLKITTTTQRHLLLKHEMDINAGRYLDGEAMPALVDEAFDLTIATASGERTQGEQAGHSQAQLWRNWRQTSAARIAAIEARPVPDGQPLPVGGDRRVRRVGAGAHRHGAHRPGPADEHVLVADRPARGGAPERLQRRPAPRHRSLRRAGALRGLRLRRRIDVRHAAADLPRLRHASQRRGGAAARARLREGAERRDAARLRARRPAARSLRLGERPARWRHRSRDRPRAAVVRHPARVPGRRARRPARRADDRRPQRGSARGRRGGEPRRARQRRARRWRHRADPGGRSADCRRRLPRRGPRATRRRARRWSTASRSRRRASTSSRPTPTTGSRTSPAWRPAARTSSSAPWATGRSRGTR